MEDALAEVGIYQDYVGPAQGQRPGQVGRDSGFSLTRQRAGDEQGFRALALGRQEEDRRRTKEAGFNAHMVKPADPGKLTELLASISIQQPREVA